MLAGIPQAPSSLNPLSNPQNAMARRNHVLSRMLEQGILDDKVYQDAIYTPLTAARHPTKIEFHAPYVAEMARHFLYERFGSDIYTQGLHAYTND